MTKLRVGQGLDAHAFAPGRKLVIGGVEIPFHLGLLGHSDADVLLHAICDALLGAAALGDIGRHFSDDDPSYKDIDSRLLLRAVHQKIRDLDFHIVNLDATVIAQAPRMAPHIPAMIINIAHDLELPTNAINIKATTTDQMGFIGRVEGIAVQAMCLLEHLARQ